MTLPEDLDQLQKLAETSAEAQFILAWFYLPKDTREKMELIDERYAKYVVAAFFGLSVDQEVVHIPFEHNETDAKQAFVWLKKAAESGFEKAYYPLAFLYFDQNNIVAAEKLAKQSENYDFKESNLILGKIKAFKGQYKPAYEYFVKALNADMKRAYGPMMKIVLKEHFDTAQAKEDIEKFKLFMLDRLKRNVTRCNENRFFGQEIRIAGSQEIDVPTDEEDDEEFESSLERIETDYQWMADQLAEVGQLSIDRMRELQAKDRELEETMAMFAHKFRSPLDAIIYNTEHDHQEKLYKQAAQTMRGLLDIFSLISTDADKLQDRLKDDRQGNGNLEKVFGKTLDMVLLHLLSASSTGIIRQHYLRHAKAQGLCNSEVSAKRWYDDFIELERQLQGEWEQSYAQLLGQPSSLESKLTWLEQRFFKLELLGFDCKDMRFSEYGITESLLTILLNEFLVNAFKYYASAENVPVVLEWSTRDDYQVLSCRNPSTRQEREKNKGSGKGHIFLSALARKIGSGFTKPKPVDDFVVEFLLADELLISS